MRLGVFRSVQTGKGAAQSCFGPGVVNVLGSLLRQPCFGTLLGCQSPFHVYLVGPLGGVGQDGNLVVGHLHESAPNGEDLFTVSLPDDQFTRLQGGDQRGVVR